MKNKGAVRWLLVANFISGIAQGISMISIPTYFAQTGQSHWFNIAYMLMTMVSLFWSIYGGTLVDKYNRKHIFLALNLTNGIAIGLIAYLEATTTGYTNYLAASVFALTFWNFNLHYPCFYAFMQEISEKEHYNKIASYIEVQSQLASALAGAGAALLISGGVSIPYTSIVLEVEPWTLAQIFALDSCTYFVALCIIFMIRFVPIARREKETGGVWERLKVGYAYLQEHSYIFLFGVVSQSVFVVVLLHVFNLAPLYVAQHLKTGAEVFAISEVFYALGAIVAGLAIHKIFGGMTIVKAIIIMTIVSVFEFLFLVGTTWILGFFVIAFLLGITNAGIRVLRISYLFKVLPNQVVGRASSIFFLTNVLTRIVFLSLFSIAFFHHSGHVIYAFLILSIFMLLSAMLLMFFYSKIIIKRERE